MTLEQQLQQAKAEIDKLTACIAERDTRIEALDAKITSFPSLVKAEDKDDEEEKSEAEDDEKEKAEDDDKEKDDEMKAELHALIAQAKATLESSILAASELEKKVQGLESNAKTATARAAQIASSVGIQPIPQPKQPAQAQEKAKTITEQCAEQKGIKL
jgi:SMC interacting uncharacterized protein involved in chromosome segregation